MCLPLSRAMKLGPGVSDQQIQGPNFMALLTVKFCAYDHYSLLKFCTSCVSIECVVMWNTHVLSAPRWIHQGTLKSRHRNQTLSTPSLVMIIYIVFTIKHQLHIEIICNSNSTWIHLASICNSTFYLSNNMQLQFHLNSLSINMQLHLLLKQ